MARAFNHRYSWVLLDTAWSNESARERADATLRGATVLPDGDVVWATRSVALDVYRVAAGRPLVVTALSPLDAAGLAQAGCGVLPAAAARRRDLAGVRLSAATVVSSFIIKHVLVNTKKNSDLHQIYLRF